VSRSTCVMLWEGLKEWDWGDDLVPTYPIGLLQAGPVAMRGTKRRLGDAFDALDEKPKYNPIRDGGVNLWDEIVVVGDGNFTFSRMLSKVCAASGEEVKLTCTTLDDLATLQERYPEVDTYIEDMKACGAEVLHNIDGVRLLETAQLQGFDWTRKFDTCIWNFPHAGVISGFFDTDALVRWRHVNLMRKFFFSVRKILQARGTVVITSNARTKHVTEDEVIKAGQTANFSLEEQFPFPEWKYCQYDRCFGDNRDHPSKKRKMATDSKNWYPSQRPELDRVYVFKMQDEEPDLMVLEESLAQPPPLAGLVASVAVCNCGLMSPNGKRYFFEETRHFAASGKCRELLGDEKKVSVRQKFSQLSFVSLAPNGFLESLANILELDIDSLDIPLVMYSSAVGRWRKTSDEARCGNNDFCVAPDGASDRLYEEVESKEWFCTKCWAAMLHVSEEEFLHMERGAVEVTAEQMARLSGKAVVPKEQAVAPEVCDNADYCCGSPGDKLTREAESGLWFCDKCYEKAGIPLAKPNGVGASPSPSPSPPPAKRPIRVAPLALKTAVIASKGDPTALRAASSVAREHPAALQYAVELADGDSDALRQALRLSQGDMITLIFALGGESLPQEEEAEPSTAAS